MKYDCCKHKLALNLILFYLMTVSEVFSQDIYFVPGCKVLLNEFSEIVARCIEFNVSFTSALLPQNTKSLQIYGLKTLPTLNPLVPHLKNLTKLELIFNNMYNISKVMFQGLENLIHLNLQMNFIKTIPSDAFVNIYNLKILDISANYILSVESIAPSLQNLKELKHLSLSSNRLLRFLKDDDFILLENISLESLDVASCVIEYIEINTFKPLKSLSSLNISYNFLPEDALRNISLSFQKDNLRDLSAKSQIEKASYFSCRFLRWLQTTTIISLDLSENRFICFPKGNYKYLRSLKLNKCSIFEQFPISFSGMPSLEHLEIKEHKLMRIDKEFKFNTRLNFLDLSNFVGMKSVNVFKIADYAFENQYQLISLYLQDLPIRTRIKRYMLYNLTRLENISFFKCIIPAIECNAFETLKHLIYLDLSFNRISELSSCLFCGLVAVKNINLNNNMISFISESQPFEYTPKLETLQLSSNKIVKLPAGGFHKLNNLGFIKLSDNFIQPWHHTFLPTSAKQVVLLLDKNAISHFTPEMFKDISDLDILDFSENPINCSDCSIQQLRTWMMNNTYVLTNFDRVGAYICSEPDLFLGVNIVEANLTLPYCFPEKNNTLKTMCIVLSTIISTFVMVFIVWYRWSWNIKYCMFLMRFKTRKYKENIDSGRYAYDACVFYCEADIKWIREHLVSALENCNSPLRLCLPDRNFDAGIVVFDNILSAINSSRSTVIVLSNNCLEDSWCLHNMQMAQNVMVEKSRSGLIILFLENIPNDKLKKDLQYVLRTRTCIWWTENPMGQKLFWERLRLAIVRPIDRGISAHIT